MGAPKSPKRQGNPYNSLRFVDFGGFLDVWGQWDRLGGLGLGEDEKQEWMAAWRMLTASFPGAVHLKGTRLSRWKHVKYGFEVREPRKEKGEKKPFQMPYALPLEKLKNTLFIIDMVMG